MGVKQPLAPGGSTQRGVHPATLLFHGTHRVTSIDTHQHGQIACSAAFVHNGRSSPYEASQNG